jgi:hypothetical protein
MRKYFLPALLFLGAAASFAADEPNHEVHQALRQLKTTMSKALNEGDVGVHDHRLDRNHSPDWHREEKRDHDDRLRARG